MRLRHVARACARRAFVHVGYDRTIVIGFIIARGDASLCNGNCNGNDNVGRPTSCHDVSYYAALYAYYGNNNDSDDERVDDDDDDAAATWKTTATLTAVMNFITMAISFPPGPA